MIIMINGAFGVGKTTVAQILAEKMEGAMLFDPEEVGFMLRELIPDGVKLPEERTGDFQDLHMWKPLTVETARLLRKLYGRHLVVPMTIYNRDYFTMIRSGFEQIDPDTYHFCLTADKETIHERLRGRGEKEGNWCYAQTDKCLSGFAGPHFEPYVATDELTAEEAADLILKEVGKK